MNDSPNKQAWPLLRSDQEEERFVAEADLTEHALSQIVPVQFEPRPKDKAGNERMSEELFDAVKCDDAQRGIFYKPSKKAIGRIVAPQKGLQQCRHMAASVREMLAQSKT